MSVILNLYRNNVAEVGTPTASDVTKNSIKVTGTVAWYKGDATWGVAYKKSSATSWTHKACASQTISVSLTSLTASTTYDIKLYVKYNGEYQYGTAIQETTSAS